LKKEEDYKGRPAITEVASHVAEVYKSEKGTKCGRGRKMRWGGRKGLGFIKKGGGEITKRVGATSLRGSHQKKQGKADSLGRNQKR